MENNHCGRQNNDPLKRWASSFWEAVSITFMAKREFANVIQ
jgi:hypothetical protein